MRVCVQIQTNIKYIFLYKIMNILNRHKTYTFKIFSYVVCLKKYLKFLFFITFLE